MKREDFISDSRGSGSDALAGYDYQIDVSIWLALDLILASKLTQELELEPASQEDLEAVLVECEPSRATSMVRLDGYILVVQAKLRSGDAWTVAGIKQLLHHGSGRRRSAADRLSARNIRYLLITSAGLNGDTRKLSVRRADEWPKPGVMPTSIAGSLPPGADGRVAVIGNQDEERVATDIRRLLTESFRVPNARWMECLQALREEARIRIRGGGSGHWRREELGRTIRAYDGYIASSPELEHYVHPRNWGDLRTAMRKRHAALIIGQSGTGKTMATRKLYEELRVEIPGLARVPITLGPGQISNDATEPPVLYDIEDPWGRFDFDRRSRPWNDQLAQAFRQATHDRLIVATTRYDVAQSAGVLQTVKPWMVALQAEHYGKAERSKLYRFRIEDLPRELQTVAAQAMTTVLAELGTPLEIQKFFDALSTIDREMLKNPDRFISEAIGQAHQNSIERTVIDQIEERNDVRAAAVVWGLLKASGRISIRAIRIIESGIAELESEMSDGVTPLIHFFVSARNLRQTEDVVAYYHPRVEAGIEQTLLRHEVVVRRTLRTLVDLLASLAGPGEEWGVGVAAKLLGATHEKPDLKPIPAVETIRKIDTWLAAQLMRDGPEFRENLKLASVCGSDDSNASELARYLLNRPDRGFGGHFQWGPPERDQAWYARLRADPTTNPIIETFIQRVLPVEHIHLPNSFATEIERLAPDVSNAFLHAAAKLVHVGVFFSAGAIAEGALRNLEGFEAIVDMAVDVLTPSEEDLREAEETRLAIVNGEYSELYAEHVAENDDGYTADEFLECYIRRVRSARGWRSIIQHRHYDRLVEYWLRDLARLAGEVTPDPEEVRGAFAAVRGSEHEHKVWVVLLHAWDPMYIDPLTARAISGHTVRVVRQTAITCFVEHAPKELIDLARNLLNRGEIDRLIEIVLDLSILRTRKTDPNRRHESAASAALSMLPPPLVEIGEACLAIENKEVPALSAEAREILKAARSGNIDVRRFRVLVDAFVPLTVEDDVRWLLTNANQSHIAVDAIEAAIRKGMTDDVEQALKHKFAHVSALALTALAEPMAAPLPGRFLAMSEVKGSPVRQALVELLDARPHAAHLPTLLQLAKDTWSKGSGYVGDDDYFPVAQAAVSAIEKVRPLFPDAMQQLYDTAIDTSDPSLRESIFHVLVNTVGSIYQDSLLDLAITPGRSSIKEAAAAALLRAWEKISCNVAERVTSNHLVAQAAPVAVKLALLLALRAGVEAVRHAAEALATDEKRRVLILLMIWVLGDRDSEAARIVARMLPADHPGVAWAFGSDIEVPNDDMLADLGDPAICAEVLVYMRPNADSPQ